MSNTISIGDKSVCAWSLDTGALKKWYTERTFGGTRRQKSVGSRRVYSKP
jgi:hypothetical protein